MKDDILAKVSARTSKDPISAKDIAKGLGVFEINDTSQAPIRGLITELIKDGNPIGSSGRGYFYISTPGELDKYLNDLESRVAGIKRRQKNVVSAFYKKSFLKK